MIAFFVDFGSGKGKCLILADLCGFRKSVGVEFSRELVEISKKNTQKYISKKDGGNKIEIFHADASAFTIRNEYNIFYFLILLTNIFLISL